METKEKHNEHKKNRTKKKIKETTLFGIKLHVYGNWSFLIGLILVLIFSLVRNVPETIDKIFIYVLMVLGIIIGTLNITRDEVVSFLLAFLVLVVFGQSFLGIINTLFGNLTFLVSTIMKFYTYLVYLLTPAALIVALITIFMTTKDE